MAKHGMILLAVGAILLVGCGKDEKAASSNPPGLVAVVDLDKIASVVGITEEMQKDLTVFRDELMGKLKDGYAKLQNEFNAKKAEFGATPTDAQKKELMELEAKSNGVLQDFDQRGGQALTERRTLLFSRYQEKVMPIARRIAQQKGMTVVLGARAQALIWDPSVDITDDVLKEVSDLRKSGAFTIAADIVPATTQPVR